MPAADGDIGGRLFSGSFSITPGFVGIVDLSLFSASLGLPFFRGTYIEVASAKISNGDNHCTPQLAK